MTSSKTALEVQHLTVSYDRISVLWDISFSVPTGKLVAIIGPNGAGKSTFIKTILGLSKPISGQIQILGQNRKDLSHQLAYIPQRETIDWDFPITVLELVLQGLYPRLGLWKRVKKCDRQKAIDALKIVEMEGYAHRQINQLSIGQQQRVFLARALLQDAQIYFLDEPFSGVDSVTEQMILKFLQEMRSKGKTLFVIYHDLKNIQKYFDWVMMLNVRLIACGETKTHLTTENLQKTYGQSANIFEEAFILAQNKILGVQSP